MIFCLLFFLLLYLCRFVCSMFGLLAFKPTWWVCLLCVWGGNLCRKAERDCCVVEISFFLLLLSGCIIVWGFVSEVLYPPVFYCQFVYATCTLTSFVYKLFFLLFFFVFFSPQFVPKFVRFWVCLLFTDLTSRGDPVFSPFCSRRRQQGQTLIVKKGIHWEIFFHPCSLPPPTYSICQQPPGCLPTRVLLVNFSLH